MTSTLFDPVDAHRSAVWSRASLDTGAIPGVHPIDVAVMGAHGGSAATTVARWLDLPEGCDADHVVVTARTNAAGLQAARDLVSDLTFDRPARRKLVALVLVADAPGRLPKPLANFAYVICGGAPAHVRIPWVDHLRLGVEPEPTHRGALKRALIVLRHVVDASAEPEPTVPASQID